MIIDNIEGLLAEIEQAKHDEARAVEHRRKLEDELAEAVGVNPDIEGVTNVEAGHYKVRLSSRINRTVDGDLLQEVAAEAGLTAHLSSLFRWKPSINMRAWKDADESITSALASAITAKPGRISITIKTTEE